MTPRPAFLTLLTVLALVAATGAVGRPIVIAHRGASGYLPEHTLEAKAYAHALRPDFLEQDVALTKDDVPIVMHDHYLDTVTDVARVFPARQRADGRYYVIDFTMDELRRLTLHERIDLATGKPVYPARFPVGAAVPFRIPTLDEELAFIGGLNRSTGADVGIYVELKAPWFHRREGKDIARVVLEVLRRHGYAERSSNAYVQCFDPACLKELRFVLKTKLRLVQLVADDSWNETPGVSYASMLTPSGLAEVARYADGIGPWIPQLLRPGAAGRGRSSGVVEAAHRAGLAVHPYTVRVEEPLPCAKTPEEQFDLLFRRLGVDGVFSDFPDRAVEWLRRAGLRR